MLLCVASEGFDGNDGEREADAEGEEHKGSVGETKASVSERPRMLRRGTCMFLSKESLCVLLAEILVSRNRNTDASDQFLVCIGTSKKYKFLCERSPGLSKAGENAIEGKKSGTSKIVPLLDAVDQVL